MGLYKDALEFFSAAPPPTDAQFVIACATSNFYAGEPSKSIRLLQGIEEIAGHKDCLPEVVECWKILSFSFGLEKDEEQRQHYLAKAYNGYLELWLKAVRYYTRTASSIAKGIEVAEVDNIPTYSSDLRLLCRLARRTVGNPKVASPKSVRLQVTRFDVFCLQLLRRTAAVRRKLCEAYSVLRRRRRLLSEFKQLRTENPGQDCQGLFEVMDAHRLWVDRFLLSGELSNRCDLATKQSLDKKPSAWSGDLAEQLKSTCAAKRLRHSLLLIRHMGLSVPGNE